MSLYVVDASVAAKWLVAEHMSESAKLLIAPQHELIAPDLLPIEVNNVLIKKVRRGEITSQEARARRDVPAKRVRMLPWETLSAGAFELAVDYSRSFYDSLYLALAVGSSCRMVTADRKLLNGLAGSALAETVMWVEDLIHADSD